MPRDLELAPHKLGYTVAEAVALTGVSRTRLYQENKVGQLKFVRRSAGGRWSPARTSRRGWICCAGRPEPPRSKRCRAPDRCFGRVHIHTSHVDPGRSDSAAVSDRGRPSVGGPAECARMTPPERRRGADSGRSGSETGLDLGRVSVLGDGATREIRVRRRPATRDERRQPSAPHHRKQHQVLPEVGT